MKIPKKNYQKLKLPEAKEHHMYKVKLKKQQEEVDNKDFRSELNYLRHRNDDN